MQFTSTDNIFIIEQKVKYVLDEPFRLPLYLIIQGNHKIDGFEDEKKNSLSAKTQN